VTVFERVPEQARGERLVPRAERLIYRAPANQLHLAIRPDKQSYAPGEPVHVGIHATNKKGQPQPAIAMIAVVDQGLLKLADEKTYRSMPAHFLLTTEVRRPEDLENADFLLSADPRAAKALDLLLGTQGWRRFAEQDPGKFQKEQKKEADRLLAFEGQSPLRSVNYGQEEVQKVVRKFQDRYAELDKLLTQAEDKQLLVRDLYKQKRERLQEEADREETKRLAALGRAKDAQESLALAAAGFQDYRELLRDLVLPIMVAVFLLATIVSLVLAFMRKWQGRAIPYIATAACSLILVAVALNQRASLLPNVMAGMETQLADVPDIEKFIPEGDIIGIPNLPRKGPLEKVPPPSLAPIRIPNVPRPMDKKDSDPTKADRQEIPAVPPRPAPSKVDQPQVPLAHEAAPRDRRQLFPQLPVPVAPSPSLIVREYSHLHHRGSGNAGPDFADTLYWHPVLVLPSGSAEIAFDLCDAEGTYQILVAGHTLDGRIAEATAKLNVHKSAIPKGNSNRGQ
jgi:hypothetical protein